MFDLQPEVGEFDAAIDHRELVVGRSLRARRVAVRRAGREPGLGRGEERCLQVALGLHGDDTSAGRLDACPLLGVEVVERRVVRQLAQLVPAGRDVAVEFARPLVVQHGAVQQSLAFARERDDGTPLVSGVGPLAPIDQALFLELVQAAARMSLPTVIQRVAQVVGKGAAEAAHDGQHLRVLAGQPERPRAQADSLAIVSAGQRDRARR